MTDEIARLVELSGRATQGTWDSGEDTLAGRVWVYVQGSPILEPLRFLDAALGIFKLRKDPQREWVESETREAKDDRFWKQKQTDAEFIAALVNWFRATHAAHHEELKESDHGKVS